MPRNIEYLIEKHLKENDFTQFVLTFAIANGIRVPREVLQKFGSDYGIDSLSFLPNEEWLQNLRNKLSTLPDPSKVKKTLTESEIQKKMDELHAKNVGEYQNNLHRYLEARGNLMFIRKKAMSKKASDRLQEKFKNTILRFVDSEIRKLKRQYAKKLGLQMKPSKAEFLKKYGVTYDNEYELLKKRIRQMEKELYVDAAFCEKLAKEWLDLK